MDIGEPVRTIELPEEEPLVLPRTEPEPEKVREPQPSEPERVPA
jgi:hypothetical protein